MEIWKPVVGSDMHEVSSLGLVRTWKNGKWGRATAPRLMKIYFGNNGYGRVTINGASRLVHHLVLESHIGPRPDGHEGAHGDGDKGNNSLANLRWATALGNGSDNARLGVSKGTLHGMHKLTEDDVREIRKYEKTYAAYAAQYGVSVATIQRVIKRKGWTHVQ